MTPDTIESAFIGLSLAVMAVLASAVMTHMESAWLWLTRGFAAGEQHGRKAASVFVFLGLLLYGMLQLVTRSRDIPLPPMAVQVTGLAGWSLFGYGAIVWQASIMASVSDTAHKAARVYLWGMVITAFACAAIVGALRPFHSVVMVSPAYGCNAP